MAMLFNDTRLHLMTTIFSTFVGFNLAYRRNLFTNDQLVICEKKISWCTFKQAMLIMAMMSIADHWFCYSAPFWHWNKLLLQCRSRVADVARARERRSPKGQGLLRKEGPPTYAILSRNLVLSRFARFLKGFHRALNESHRAFVELSTKAIMLS